MVYNANYRLNKINNFYANQQYQAKLAWIKKHNNEKKENTKKESK